ncbi:MAG: ParB/RepB/Spo0J family partition protein/stage 0 sporulation protein J [Treponematales bacterium]
MAKKTGLGKGLDALLQDGAFEEAPAGEAGRRSGALALPLDAVAANLGQPRKAFDEAELAELAASIRENGVINPIIVEETGNGAYTIVAGERRYRAAKLAGLAEIPALVRAYSDEKRIVISLIENIQRADLKPLEEAAGYRSLMELTGLSQEEVAAKVGKNRTTVTNALRLLKLPRDIQQSLEAGEITPGHGRALLSVTGAGAREQLFRDIVKGGLSVREAEKRAAALNAADGGPERGREKKPAAQAKAARPPELAAMEEKFMHRLGAKTVINGTLERGVITIDYYSMEDLDRLYGLLGGTG